MLILADVEAAVLGNCLVWGVERALELEPEWFLGGLTPPRGGRHRALFHQLRSYAEAGRTGIVDLLELKHDLAAGFAVEVRELINLAEGATVEFGRLKGILKRAATQRALEKALRPLCDQVAAGFGPS